MTEHDSSESENLDRSEGPTESDVELPTVRLSWEGLFPDSKGTVDEDDDVSALALNLALKHSRGSSTRLVEIVGIPSELQSKLSAFLLKLPKSGPQLLEVVPGSTFSVRLLVPPGSGDSPKASTQAHGATPVKKRPKVTPLASTGRRGQNFIARGRAPRVAIEYDVELYGADKKIELPFVMGVLADLSGNPAEPLSPVVNRRFMEIDSDSFDDRMKTIGPRLAFQVPNTLTGDEHINVDMTFAHMDDFAPASVARRIPELRSLLFDRAKLTSIRSPHTTRNHSDFEEAVAEIDRQLTEQLNLVLNHEGFRELEGIWRGLSYLVSNCDTDETLKLKVLDISKNELNSALCVGSLDTVEESPLYDIVHREFRIIGGEPLGCLVGDFYFDHSPRDVALLERIARLGESASIPIIAGAAPTVCGLSSWQELANPRDLAKIFTTPEYATWRSLRASASSRYIGLAMPRFLARQPYGAKSDPVEEFHFEEDAGTADSTRYTWANSAYAMAVNINRAFKDFGWFTRIFGIESGGAVEGLPTHMFPASDGGVDMKCPTEIAISDRREAELSKNGFMPLMHRKGSDLAAFISAPSLQEPALYDDPDATASANLAARMPYLLATCRFAHYLKCIARDKIGSFSQREDLQKWLQQWIGQYVEVNPANSSQAAKARRPLAAAEVLVEEMEGDPSYYSVKSFLRPHYQLEGLSVDLRTEVKIPRSRNETDSIALIGQAPPDGKARAVITSQGPNALPSNRRDGPEPFEGTAQRRSPLPLDRAAVTGRRTGCLPLAETLLSEVAADTVEAYLGMWPECRSYRGPLSLRLVEFLQESDDRRIGTLVDLLGFNGLTVLRTKRGLQASRSQTTRDLAHSVLGDFGLEPLQCPEGGLTIRQRLAELVEQVTTCGDITLHGIAVQAGTNIEHALKDLLLAYATWKWVHAEDNLKQRGWIVKGRQLASQTLGVLVDALVRLHRHLQRDREFCATFPDRLGLLDDHEIGSLTSFVTFRNQLVHGNTRASPLAPLRDSVQQHVSAAHGLIARWVGDGVYPRVLVPMREIHDHVGCCSYDCSEEGIQEATVVTSQELQLRSSYYCMGLNNPVLIEPILIAHHQLD